MLILTLILILIQNVVNKKFDFYSFNAYFNVGVTVQSIEYVRIPHYLKSPIYKLVTKSFCMLHFRFCSIVNGKKRDKHVRFFAEGGGDGMGVYCIEVEQKYFCENLVNFRTLHKSKFCICVTFCEKYNNKKR